MNSNNWPSFPLSDPQFYLGLVNDDEDDINNIAAAVAVTPFENQESSKYKVDEVEAMCNLQQLTLFTGAKKQPDQPPPTSGQRTSIYRGGHGGMRIIYGIIVAEGKASPGKDVKCIWCSKRSGFMFSLSLDNYIQTVALSFPIWDP